MAYTTPAAGAKQYESIFDVVRAVGDAIKTPHIGGFTESSDEEKTRIIFSVFGSVPLLAVNIAKTADENGKEFWYVLGIEPLVAAEVAKAVL